MTRGDQDAAAGLRPIACINSEQLSGATSLRLSKGARNLTFSEFRPGGVDARSGSERWRHSPAVQHGVQVGATRGGRPPQRARGDRRAVAPRRVVALALEHLPARTPGGRVAGAQSRARTSLPSGRSRRISDQFPGAHRYRLRRAPRINRCRSLNLCRCRNPVASAPLRWVADRIARIQRRRAVPSPDKVTAQSITYCDTSGQPARTSGFSASNEV